MDKNMTQDLTSFGYADGLYWGRCTECASGFTGAKRSWKCKSCATKAFARHRHAAQTDAQMAAPDALAEATQSIREQLSTRGDEWIRIGEADARTILASLSASNDSNAMREVLEDHFPSGLRSRVEVAKDTMREYSDGIVRCECKCGEAFAGTDEQEVRQLWADHARAALASTPKLDPVTVEACAKVADESKSRFENCMGRVKLSQDILRYSVLADAAEDIASAIRALKDKA